MLCRLNLAVAGYLLFNDVKNTLNVEVTWMLQPKAVELWPIPPKITEQDMPPHPPQKKI